MHFLSLLWHAVWFFRVALQAVLLCALLQRRFNRQFPVFVLYTSWAVLQGSTLVAMDFLATGNQYRHVYLFGAVGGAVLSFGVIYELFMHLMQDYPVLSGAGNSLYRWSALTFLLIAFALAWTTPASGPDKVIATFFVVQRTLRLLQCGLLVFLFIFARSFGLSWKSRAFGIALGFGITATMSLMMSAIRAQIEPGWATLTTDILQLIAQAGDVAAVTVWLVYAVARETDRMIPPAGLPEEDLQSWIRALRRLLP